MAIRGTENYVFYMEQKLGAGSTGAVYYGRHKRKGDPCACKLFSLQDSASKISVKNNELAFMRQLQHPNIVQLLAIEPDSRSKETVLVMELCAEGSLQKILGEPENVYGLAEELFVDFLSQFVLGLEYLVYHGIFHRDIKPGNILCCKSEEGRMIYKLTDFGATRELHTSSASNPSNPLYGTEEYLYPEIYRRVFITKEDIGNEYQTNADIWSIGVTIYQVATGQLPFQVQGGRNNRQKMYLVISQKATGMISGVQSTNSDAIVYQDKLPATCSLSPVLQENVVHILANTLEVAPLRQWTSEMFFPYCKKMMNNSAVVVFHAAIGLYHRIYVCNGSKFSEVRKEIERVTNIAFDNQILIYGMRFIHDIDSAATDIEAFPTSEENPVVLLPNSPKPMGEFVIPALPSKPVDADGSNLASDAVWSRVASATCHRCLVISKRLINCQLIFESCKQSSWSYLITRYRYINEVYGDLKETIDAVVSNLRLAESEKQKFEIFLDEKVSVPGFHDEKSTMSAKTLLAQLGQCLNNLESSRISLANMRKVVDATLAQVQNISRQFHPNPVVSACKEKRCAEKYHLKYRRSYEINTQFHADKTRTMSYNDDQIHKYDRMKLAELLDDVIKSVQEHCIKLTKEEHVDFWKFICDWFLPYEKRLGLIERNVREIRSTTAMMTEELSQITSEVNTKWRQYNVSPSMTAPTSSAKPGIMQKFFSTFRGSSSSKTSSQLSNNSEEAVQKLPTTPGATKTEIFKGAELVPSSKATDDSASCTIPFSPELFDVLLEIQQYIDRVSELTQSVTTSSDEENLSHGSEEMSIGTLVPMT